MDVVTPLPPWFYCVMHAHESIFEYARAVIASEAKRSRGLAARKNIVTALEPRSRRRPVILGFVASRAWSRNGEIYDQRSDTRRRPSI
jgi:hypothetical protein